MKKFLFSTVCALALIGCGDSNIDIVKNATLDINKTMTIGAAIDGSKQCESVKWEDTSKDGQNIVTATCEIKKEILENEFKEEQKAFNFKKNFNELKITSEYLTIAKDLRNKCKSDLKLPDNQGILELTKKHCELHKRTKLEFSILVCKETISEEINKFNCTPKYDSYYLSSLLTPLAYYVAVGEEIVLFETPKEVKSRIYKINFFVNTDKSVDVKDAFVINDGEEDKVYYYDSLLSKIYKR
ncbi:hypothetical protein [Campylobacter sp. MG1]|uniref:hypothetical protein n=1 Tax=Campylobacter sp. MG1 TaxID=2976332 RepID=UPI00226CBC5D|nr:hypothetical protein [Campylobacter sp. MG1]